MGSASIKIIIAGLYLVFLTAIDTSTSSAMPEVRYSLSDLYSYKVLHDTPLRTKLNLGDSPLLLDLPDADLFLKAHFPGQFFSSGEIKNISKASKEKEEKRVWKRMTRKRRKRELDADICCKTDVWFGPAPAEMNDVYGDGPWQMLRGMDAYQAYSRGDCHSDNPQNMCPKGGKCVQKKRLHMLWVQEEQEAVLKYFHVSSHCTYEQQSENSVQD